MARMLAYLEGKVKRYRSYIAPTAALYPLYLENSSAVGSTAFFSGTTQGQDAYLSYTRNLDWPYPPGYWDGVSDEEIDISVPLTPRPLQPCNLEDFQDDRPTYLGPGQNIPSSQWKKYYDVKPYAYCGPGGISGFEPAGTWSYHRELGGGLSQGFEIYSLTVRVAYLITQSELTKILALGLVVPLELPIYVPLTLGELFRKRPRNLKP